MNINPTNVLVKRLVSEKKKFCPACKGGTKLVMHSKTGAMIPCSPCGGTGVLRA